MIKKCLHILFKPSMVRFLAVGCLGLASDIASLYILRHLVGLVTAKAISYLIALLVTWLCNRRFTFKVTQTNIIKECTRYSIIYISTGILHVALFAFLVHHFIFFYQHPGIAVLIVALIIAFINFTLLRLFTYKKDNSPEKTPSSLANTCSQDAKPLDLATSNN